MTAGCDILIVGAGSAGSILAERLSADQACRVTVVESGPGLDLPAIRSLTADGLRLPIGPDSPVVRRYRTALTSHPHRTAEVVRGSCLGGSGAVNGGYFCRALPADFEAPAVPGWSWAEVVEHYRAVEDRIDVRRTTEFGSGTTTFLESAGIAGYRWLPDLNAEPVGVNAPPGVAAVPLNIIDGFRNGPGAAFLEPALGRPNLSVLTGTRVTGLAIARGQAVGVDAVGPSGRVRLHADRVVLSAGAIGSAHLLMLSGVGPADDLRANGIPVVVDLPVGQRCRDHPEWLMHTDWQSEVGRPVLEAVLVTGDLEIRPYTTGFGGGPPAVGVALMRPLAHGRVSLTSADPARAPLIEHRYDSEPTDVAVLRAGCDGVVEMLGGTTVLSPPAWSTSQHLCGTAPIGGDSDEHAVVDPRCEVRGVRGLSVVDGSVLPRIPGRGPHATIAMLAHRAAEFFRG